MSRPLRAAIVSAALASSAVAAYGAQYTALVGRTGAVAISRTGSDTVLASIQPGLFESGWRYAGVVAAGASSPAGQGVVRSQDGKVTVKAVSSVTAEGTRLVYRCSFTPDGPLSVNSVHVSVNTPAAPWVGQAWIAGGSKGVVPPSGKELNLYAAGGRQLTLKSPDQTIAISAEDGQGVRLQDNRFFGSGELEMRVGPPMAMDHAWKAGETVTVAFAIDLGGPVTTQKEEPLTLKADADWIPLDYKLDILPGSALDFGFLADAPAGKHGRVIAGPDGHFHFADTPGKPVRFYGVNLCFSANYLDKATADRVAERLMRLGYNTVRIHHYERDLIDPAAPDSLTILPDSMDKLDYLVAQLKKRGIYVKTDLYVSRPIRPTEAPDFDAFKVAVLVSDKAFDNWAAFSRKLLSHVNPYTGIAWKDDPTVAFLSCINEPNLTSCWSAVKGELRDQFQVAWTQWLKERYGSDAKVAAAWGGQGSLTAPLPASLENNARGRDLGAFFAMLHTKGYRRMRAVLRDQIGTKALLTYLNGWSEAPAFMACRTDFDWVDNHFYWDHPRFLGGEWRLPSEGGSGGGSALAQGGTGPNNVSATRLYGKPFSVSEFNYAAPNRYRAEGGFIMGAASALQDWDAVWRFAYSHSRENVANPGALGYFDMAADPAGLASERAAVLFFVRGDVKPAPGAVTLVRSRSALLEPTAALPDSDMNRLTMVTKVGVKVVDGPASPSSVPTVSLDPANVRSETGEIAIVPGQQSMVVNTPRSCAIIGPTDYSAVAGPIAARFGGSRGTLLVSALDDRPVATSRKLLLVHVTDVENTGERYSSPNRQVLEEWGHTPHLVRAGSASVTLKRADAARLKAWRLDTSGKRTAALPIKVQAGAAILDLSVQGPDGKATMYYEVAVE